MMYPMIQFSISVLPTCELATTNIFLTPSSVKASMISFRYGVLDVFHFPASAEFSGDSTLYLSAHSETVIFSGAFSPAHTFASSGFSFSIASAVSSLFFRSFFALLIHPFFPLSD